MAMYLYKGTGGVMVPSMNDSVSWLPATKILRATQTVQSSRVGKQNLQ